MAIDSSSDVTPLAKPDVTVLIVSYNTVHLLDRMFATLRAGLGSLKAQIIVVDNASRDASVAHLRANYPDVELIANSVNVGFGRANNQALPFVRGRYVLLLNTDAFMSPDALVKTVQFMDGHREFGVLGIKLLGEDGSLQPCCRYFPTPWNVFALTVGLSRFLPGLRLVDDMSWDHASIRECDWVPGCYYLVRRETLDQVGLFDPRYFVYCEEVDHCRAVRAAGWRVVYYPFAHAIHLGGESAKSDGRLSQSGRQISRLQIESDLLYFRKQYGLSGLLVWVLLTITADVIVSMKSIMKRFEFAGAASAAKHSWTVLLLLFATGMASRATR